jgi:hypothetical protein
MRLANIARNCYDEAETGKNRCNNRFNEFAANEKTLKI